jgi:hypothetical protein
LDFRRALQAIRRKSTLDTPGISIGDWKDRKRPLWERSSGSRAKRSWPLNVALPAVTS